MGQCLNHVIFSKNQSEQEKLLLAEENAAFKASSANLHKELQDALTANLSLEKSLVIIYVWFRIINIGH